MSATKYPTHRVKCPCCEKHDLLCEIDPGEPMVTSGPSEDWYPGSPAQVTSIDPEDCDCREYLEHLDTKARREGRPSFLVTQYEADVEERVFENWSEWDER